MAKKLTGKTVKLTRNMAIWYLENPEVFYAPNDTSNVMDEDHLIAVQMAMLILLGGQVTGIATKEVGDPQVYSVEIKSPFGEYRACYGYPRDIHLVRK